MRIRASSVNRVQHLLSIDQRTMMSTMITSHLSFLMICPSLPPSTSSYGRGSFSFSGLITGITQRFSTEFELKEVQSPLPKETKTSTRQYQSDVESNPSLSHALFRSSSVSSWSASRSRTSRWGSARPRWLWSRR